MKNAFHPAPTINFNVSASKDLHLFVEPSSAAMGGVVIITEDEVEGREDIGVKVYVPNMHVDEEPAIQVCDINKKSEMVNGSITAVVSSVFV